MRSGLLALTQPLGNGSGVHREEDYANRPRPQAKILLSTHFTSSLTPTPLPAGEGFEYPLPSGEGGAGAG